MIATRNDSLYMNNINDQIYPTTILPGIYSFCPYLETLLPSIHLKKNPIQPKKSGNDIFENIMINPMELGFVPKTEWNRKTFSLIELKKNYFTKRKGVSSKFEYKLYNSLLITRKYPDLYNFIGTIWVSSSIMKIDSNIFGNLLGIHCVQGGLFHKQGNFIRNGFNNVILSCFPNLIQNPLCKDVDDHNIRLFFDQFQRFSRDKEFVVIDDLRI